MGWVKIVISWGGDRMQEDGVGKLHDRAGPWGMGCIRGKEACGLVCRQTLPIGVSMHNNIVQQGL